MVSRQHNTVEVIAYGVIVYCFVVSVSDSRSSLKNLQVVLDLDETLVCAYETSSLPSTVHSQAIEAGVKCFDLECVSSENVGH